MKKSNLCWIFVTVVFLQSFHRTVSGRELSTSVTVTTNSFTTNSHSSTNTTTTQVSTNTPLRTTTARTTTTTTNTPTSTPQSATSSTTLKTTTSTATTRTSNTQRMENCSPGYVFENGACKDLNECQFVQCPVTTKCNNLVGSYVCVCGSGLVKRKLPDDNEWKFNNVPRNDISISVFCLYTITVKQHFGLTFTPALLNTSSPDYQNLTETIYQRIMVSYMEADQGVPIVDINIFALTNNPFLVHYEVMSEENITVDTTTLVAIHNRSVNAGFWSSPNGFPGVIVDLPTPGLVICLDNTVQSRQVRDRTFNFAETKVDTLKASNQTCANSGYAAFIKCVARTNKDGSVSAYYEVATLQELSCSKNTSELNKQVNTTNLTSQTLETTLGVLSATSTYTSPELVKDIILILDELQQTTLDKDIDVTENTMTFLLWTVDNIHDAVQTPNSSMILTNEDKLTFARILEIFGSNLVIENEAFSVKSDTKFFQAKKINCTHGNESLYFNETLSKDNDSFQPGVISVIPRSAIPSSCSESINVVFLLHRDSTMFPTSVHNINQIFSSQLARTSLQNLKEPITHSFSQPARSKEAAKHFLTHRCAYLDLDTGKWLHDGCTVTVVSTGNTVCDCDHTTSFAVLVQSYPVPGSYALSIFAYIGCSFSILGLILVIVIYLSFKKLRTNQINQLHIHLSFCLIVAYLTFLIGSDRTSAYASCMTVGFILQFSFLSAWGWMLAECFTMYKKFVKVFSHMSSAYIKKASCIVYSLSLFVTVVTFVVAYIVGTAEYSGWAQAADNDGNFYPSYYVSDRLCWLHGYSLYFGFLTPVGLMFVANIFGYIRIIRILTNSQTELRSNKVNKNDLKTQAFRILTVSVLLGVTWAFAIPLTFTDDVTVNEVFSWLFSISNAFQGVFIFLLFCIKREDVRSMWIKHIPLLNKTLLKKKPTSSTGTSSSGAVGNSTSDTATTITTDNKYPGTNVKQPDDTVKLKQVKNIQSIKYQSNSSKENYVKRENNEKQENDNKNNSGEIPRMSSIKLTRLQQQSYGKKHAKVVTHF